MSDLEVNLSSTLGLAQAYSLLKMSNFRGIDSFMIYLPTNGIILLDGPRGIGKTTLLEALSFVLYDGAGNSCYPRKDRNSRKKHNPTWVELTFPQGLIVYRQRRPNLLRIQGQGIMLSDDSAQEYLNRLFGPINSWLVGGYLEQGELNSFFTLSANEKFNLLQQLSLPDRFEALLAKNTAKMTEIHRLVQEQEVQIKVYAEMYMRFYNSTPVEVRDQPLWSEEVLMNRLERFKLPYFPNTARLNSLEQLKVTVDKFNLKETQRISSAISTEQIKLTRIQESQRQREQLVKSFQVVEAELNELPNNLIETITELEKELVQLTEQIAVAQKSEKRAQLLAAKTEIQRRLNLLPTDRCEYTSKQLDIFQDLLAGPDVEQLTEELIQVNLAKQYQQQIILYNQRQALTVESQTCQNELAKLPTESSETTIDILNKQIWAIKLYQSLSASIRDCYIELDKLPTESVEVELESLSKQISILKVYQPLSQAIKECQSELDRLPTESVEGEIETITKQIWVLERYQPLVNAIRSCQLELDKLPTESSQDDIETLTKQIWLLSLHQQKLTCPKCDSSVYLNDGQLNLIECEYFGPPMDELITQKNQSQQKQTLYQQRSGQEQKLKQLQEQLNALPEVKEPIPTMGELITQKNQLRQRQELFQQRAGQEQKLKQLQEELAKLPEVKEPISPLTELIVERTKLQQKQLLFQQRETHEQKLKQLQEQLATLPQIEEPIPSVDELITQKNQLQQKQLLFQQRAGQEQKLKQLQDELIKLPEIEEPIQPKLVNLTNYQLTNLQEKLTSQRAARSQVPVIDIETERQKLICQQDRARLQTDVQQISTELDSIQLDEVIPVDVSNLEFRRNQTTQELQQKRTSEKQRDMLQAKANSLKSQLSHCSTELPNESVLEGLRQELTGLTQELQELQQEITVQIQLGSMIQLYSEHQKYEKCHQEHLQHLAALQKIKATLITAEYIILDHVLTQINSTLAEILNLLFTEPISIKIRSLKQLKTDDRIKPQINCEILYKGEECTNIRKDLSGGERSQVSLALAIAFSKFTKVPFLLLDECLSSLDVVTKESTIKVIKHYLGDKVTIAVNHDTTAGVYDAAIQLSRK